MSIRGKVKQKIGESVESHELREYAQEEGLVTLKSEGIRLIKAGETTSEEIIRVALGMQEG
jgi:type II secretory ATPase GspE/PulE/Tfp pilus assembly ATPase PilB-like protein